MGILSRLTQLFKGSNNNTKSSGGSKSKSASYSEFSRGARAVSNFGSTALNRKYEEQKRKEEEQKRKVEKAFKAQEPAQQLKTVAKQADGSYRNALVYNRNTILARKISGYLYDIFRFFTNKVVDLSRRFLRRITNTG